MHILRALTLSLLVITSAIAADPTANLFKAIAEGNLENFEQALEQGADVNKTHPALGTTPLMECFGHFMYAQVEASNNSRAAKVGSVIDGILGSVAAGFALSLFRADKLEKVEDIMNQPISESDNAPVGEFLHRKTWAPMPNTLPADLKGANRADVEKLLTTSSADIKKLTNSWPLKLGFGKAVAIVAASGVALGSFVGLLCYIASSFTRNRRENYKQMIYQLCDHPAIDFSVADVRNKKTVADFVSNMLNPALIVPSNTLFVGYTLSSWHDAVAVTAGQYKEVIRPFFEELAQHVHNTKGVSLLVPLPEPQPTTTPTIGEKNV
jgi:hypothetical protein